jgi:SAM-dependent methyltransferase
VDVARVRAKWQGAGAGERYARERWSSERRRQRDPALVAALLAEHLPAREGWRLLDAPCGTGRLAATLARSGRCIGIDVSAAMLAEARASRAPALLVRGDVTHLPFRDSSFDAVVCCRLLHHLDEPEALAGVLGELVRVSRALVIASFWDAGSLPAWRARLFPHARPPRRLARSRRALVQAFARAGAEVVGWKHALRFASRQAFVAARKCSGP